MSSGVRAALEMQKPEYDFDTVLKGSAEHLSVFGVEQCPVTYLWCCGSEKGGDLVRRRLATAQQRDAERYWATLVKRGHGALGRIRRRW